MKHIIILFALLFAGQAWGQVPDVIPENYERRFKRLERKIERSDRRTGDTIVHLDPIESLPITPTFYAMETGNWGPSYLGINSRIDDINGRKRRKVAVFIFDTGGCYDHPFLKDVAWNDLGKSFTGESCQDGHGHSTHVAGIIAAHSPDYPLGAARMLRDGFIKLIPVKVLNNGGSGAFSWITAGTKYANEEAKKLIAQGWFVVYNYSIGGGSSYAPLEEAFKEAEALGVLINVAANGNTGKAPPEYPGRSQYTLGTAALQQSGGGVERASYSSYGPETWGAAPGSSILSTYKDGRTAILSGTSMAAPHLCGVFAILASVNPNATADELKAHYIKYAADLGSPGRDEYYGYGAGIIGPLLDNPMGSQPDPPRCDDGKKNGDETGIDCGGKCPPCEVPEPEKPEYRPRILDVNTSGPWAISWWRTGQGKSTPPEDGSAFGVSRTLDGVAHTHGASCYDLDATAVVSPAGMTQIKVIRMAFRANSETVYEWEYNTLSENAAEFFRNRAIGTPAKWDVYESARYITFFLDHYAATLAEKSRIQDIQPTLLEIEWEGVRLVLGEKDLIDYKNR